MGQMAATRGVDQRPVLFIGRKARLLFARNRYNPEKNRHQKEMMIAGILYPFMVFPALSYSGNRAAMKSIFLDGRIYFDYIYLDFEINISLFSIGKGVFLCFPDVPRDPISPIFSGESGDKKVLSENQMKEKVKILWKIFIKAPIFISAKSPFR